MGKISDARLLGAEVVKVLNTLVSISKGYDDGMAQGQAAMMALQEAHKLRQIQFQADGSGLEEWLVIWRI